MLARTRLPSRRRHTSNGAPGRSAEPVLIRSRLGRSIPKGPGRVPPMLTTSRLCLGLAGSDVPKDPPASPTASLVWARDHDNEVIRHSAFYFYSSNDDIVPHLRRTTHPKPMASGIPPGLLRVLVRARSFKRRNIG